MFWLSLIFTKYSAIYKKEVIIRHNFLSKQYMTKFKKKYLKNIYAFHTSSSNLIVIYLLGKYLWSRTTHPEVFDLQGRIKTTLATEGASGDIGHFTIPDCTHLGTVSLWNIYLILSAIFTHRF